MHRRIETHRTQLREIHETADRGAAAVVQLARRPARGRNLSACSVRRERPWNRSKRRKRSLTRNPTVRSSSVSWLRLTRGNSFVSCRRSKMVKAFQPRKAPIATEKSSGVTRQEHSREPQRQEPVRHERWVGAGMLDLPAPGVLCAGEAGKGDEDESQRRGGQNKVAFRSAKVAHLFQRTPRARMNTANNNAVVRTKSPFAPRKLRICSSGRHER